MNYHIFFLVLTISLIPNYSFCPRYSKKRLLNVIQNKKSKNTRKKLRVVNPLDVFWQAIRQNKASIIHKLLNPAFDKRDPENTRKKVWLSSYNEYGRTPLSLSIQYGHINCAEQLLKNGADPNNKNKNGQLPLFVAFEYGQYSIAQLLLDYQADINRRDAHGNTLLHYVVKESNLKKCIWLLEHGASILKNEKKITPIELAIAKKNEILQSVIEESLINKATIAATLFECPICFENSKKITFTDYHCNRIICLKCKDSIFPNSCPFCRNPMQDCSVFEDTSSKN